MQQRAVFDATIEDLEKLTTPLTDELREIYFESLKKWPAAYIEKAVKTLIQTYRSRRFPSIPVFRRVLDHIEIRENLPPRGEKSPHDDFPCPACGDLGWWVEYRENDDWGKSAGLPQTPHYVATYCQCRFGVKRKEAIDAYFHVIKRIEEKKRERALEPPDTAMYDEEK